MANEIPIGGLQLLFTESGAEQTIAELKSLGEALAELRDASKGGGLGAKAKQLAELSKAIDSLKTTSVQRVDKLAKSLTTLSEVRLSSSTYNQLYKIGQALDGIDPAKVDRMSKALKKVSDTRTEEQPTVVNKEVVSEVQSTTETLDLGLQTSEAQDYTEAIEEAKSATEGLIQTQVTESSEKPFDSSTESAKELEQTTVSASSSIGRLFSQLMSVKGLTLGSDSSEVFALIREKANSAIAPVGALAVKLYDVAKARATSTINGISSALEKLKEKTIGTNTFLGKMIRSLKRILYYRTIRKMFSEIAQGFKEGTENLYLWSDAFDRTRTFANSMDKIATAILYVKNSLGALVAPIINAVAPALDYLADKFVAVLNIWNEFISAITGASTYTVAKKVPTQFKEIEKSAKGATKAVKSFTIGIDELNIIEDTGSAGGAGGSAGKIAEDWFETQTVSQDMKDIAGKVKEYTNEIVGYFEHLTSGDWIPSWEDLGEALVTGWEDLGDAVADAYDKFKDDPFGTIDTALSTMLIYLSPLPLAWELFGESVSNVWKEFRDNPVVNFVEDYLSPMPLYFEIASAMAFNFSQNIKDLGGRFEKLGEKIVKLSDYASPLPLAFAVFENLKKWVKDPIGNLEKLRDIISSFVEDLTPINLYAEAFKNICDGILKIVKKIKKFFGNIVDDTKNISSGNLLSVFSNSLGNNTKSFRKGESDGEEYVKGVEKGISTKNPTKGMFEEATKEATRSGKASRKNFEDGFSSVGNGSLKSKGASLGSSVLSAFTTNASYSKFKKAGEDIVNGIIAGLDAKKGNVYKKISVVAQKTGSKFDYTLKIGSPSKVFAESGKWTMLGYIKGVEDYEDKTYNAVENWADKIVALAPVINPESIVPNMSDIVTSVGGAITANENITTTAVADGMTEFMTDTLLPIITNIATDTKRQADKNETTEVVLDNRKVTQAVNRQNRTNGFSFT